MAKKKVEVIENNNWRVITENWNVSKMLGMNKRRQLDYFSHLQRGIIWDVKTRSAFINSVLWGMPSMSSPVFSRNGDNYRCIDGKQRSLCLFDYVADKFALRGVEGKLVYSVEKGNFMDVNNQKFSQLDESLKERIMNFTFSIAVLEGTEGNVVTEEIEEEFFRRANSGKAVSKVDIAMSVAKCMDAVLEVIGDVSYTDKGKPIVASNFFADCYGIKKFMAGTVPKEIVLKTFYLLHPDRLEDGADPTFISVGKLSEISKNSVITDREKEELKDIFNFVWDARKAVWLSDVDGARSIAKQGTGKNVLLAYVPLIHRFKDPEQLAEWIIYLFKDLPDELESAIREGTGTRAKTEIRQKFIRDSITKFLEDYDTISETFDFSVRYDTDEDVVDDDTDDDIDEEEQTTLE